MFSDYAFETRLKTLPKCKHFAVNSYFHYTQRQKYTANFIRFVCSLMGPR
jgi:hypothetical protein